MTEETVYDYSPPVSKLLTAGDPRNQPGWPDYLKLGLTEAQIPELIRMVRDEDLLWADSDSQEVWAPIHAWRALAQLRAEAAVEPLLELMPYVDEEYNDWIMEELPEVFGHIGQAAIEPLRRFLADSSYGLWSRITVASAFAEIGQRHPELREPCVAALTGQLKQFKTQDSTLNSFIISYLVDLKATEAAPVIAQAFAANQVDTAVQGDWEDIQVQLGLLAERQTPPPNYQAHDPIRQKLKEHQRQQSEAKRQLKAKRKARRKQRRKTRKKQRKQK